MSVSPFCSNIAAQTLHLLDHTTLVAWCSDDSRTAHLQHSITHETMESLAATSARRKVYAKRTIQISFFVFSCRAHSDQSSSHPSWISLPRLSPFTSTMVLSRGRVRLYGTLVLITLTPPASQYSDTVGAGIDVRSSGS